MQPLFINADDRSAGAACHACGTTLRAGEPVALCGACAAPHHRRCWERTAACSSYECAPANRKVNGLPPEPASAAFVITSDQISSATPLPPPRPVFRMPPTAPGQGGDATPGGKPKFSRTAIAAIICAVAGIVFFGVPGIAAVILGAISLAPITSGKRRGAWITAIAIMLGVVDVVGWVVVVGKVFKNHPAAGLNIADFRVSEADLKGAPPIVASALRANVLITRGGPLSLTLGSGVILSIADGSALILTNNHVASPDTRDEGGEVTVQYVDGRTATGKVVWNAPQGVDASLVRVPIPSGCAAGVATIDLSIAPHIGDDVFAVGNPQGLGWTHTKGAISQFRERSAGSASPVSLRIIQTSAPINHGNSGGGLYAAAGQLVGINTYAADKREAEGLGFAISLDSLKVVMPQWAIDAIKAARKPAPKAEGAEEGTP